MEDMDEVAMGAILALQLQDLANLEIHQGEAGALQPVRSTVTNFSEPQEHFTTTVSAQ